MQKTVRRLTFVDIGEWWRREVKTCEETCARLEGGCNERHSCAYATMCMFYMEHSWAILEGKGFDFAWRLDDDGMVESPLMVDIAAVMKSQGWVYGVRHVRRSNHGIMSDGQVRRKSGTMLQTLHLITLAGLQLTLSTHSPNRRIAESIESIGRIAGLPRGHDARVREEAQKRRVADGWQHHHP